MPRRANQTKGRSSRTPSCDTPAACYAYVLRPESEKGTAPRLAARLHENPPPALKPSLAPMLAADVPRRRPRTAPRPPAGSSHLHRSARASKSASRSHHTMSVDDVHHFVGSLTGAFPGWDTANPAHVGPVTTLGEALPFGACRPPARASHAPALTTPRPPLCTRSRRHHRRRRVPQDVRPHRLRGTSVSAAPA